MIERSRVERVGVVVPAKNESFLLPHCLHALALAASAVELPVHVVVVLDACVDDSARLVADFSRRVTRSSPTLRVSAREISASSVGAARAAGMRVLTDDVKPAGDRGMWLATTDADSTVPAHWLRAQLAHAAHGADVVVGTVQVRDWRGRTMAVAARAEREYAQRPAGLGWSGAHHHVHGANLGFRATAYRSVGGFAAVPTNEDVRLVERCVREGIPIAWALDLAVTTSARRAARAPGGFAAHLARLEALDADGVAPFAGG